MRKEKRKLERMKEIRELNKLIPKLETSNYSLIVTYVSSGVSYVDFLKQSEIYTTDEWIKQIVSVSIKKPKDTIVLTSYRARKLIKLINSHNIKKKAKKVDK